MAADVFPLFYWLFIWSVALVYTYWNESRLARKDGDQAITSDPDEPPIGRVGPMLVIVFGGLATWTYLRFDAIDVVDDAVGASGLPDLLAMTLLAAPPIALTLLLVTVASVARARSSPDQQIGDVALGERFIWGLRASVVELAPFVAIGAILYAVGTTWNSLAAIAATAAVLFLCWEFVRYQSMVGWGSGVRAATDKERARVAEILGEELPDRHAIRIFATDADWPHWALRAEDFDYRVTRRTVLDEVVLQDAGPRAELVRAFLRESHRSRSAWTSFLTRLLRAAVVTTALIAVIPSVPPTPAFGQAALAVIGAAVLWVALALLSWDRWYGLDRAVAEEVGREQLLDFLEEIGELLGMNWLQELYHLSPSCARRIAALEGGSRGADSTDVSAEGGGPNVDRTGGE